MIVNNKKTTILQEPAPHFLVLGYTGEVGSITEEILNFSTLIPNRDTVLDIFGSNVAENFDEVYLRMKMKDLFLACNIVNNTMKTYCSIGLAITTGSRDVKGDSSKRVSIKDIENKIQEKNRIYDEKIKAVIDFSESEIKRIERNRARAKTNRVNYEQQIANVIDLRKDLIRKINKNRSSSKSRIRKNNRQKEVIIFSIFSDYGAEILSSMA